MNLLADFFLISGFLINAILLSLILASKKNRPSRIILIFILVQILITILFFYAILHRIKFLYVITFFIDDGSRLLAGPLFYFYIKTIFIQDYKIARNLYHFIPFIVWWLVFTIPYTISLYNGKLAFEYLSFLEETSWPSILHDIVLLIYLYLSITSYRDYVQISKLNFSKLPNLNNSWIKKFLYSFFIVVSIDLVIRTSELFITYETPWDLGYLSVIILILATIYLGYNGLKQSTFYLPEFLIETSDNNIKKRIYISDHEALELQPKFIQLMKEKKPYLKSELTLSDLAESLSISDKKLSAFLNESMNVSFYDLINSYRVEEFKEKIRDSSFENQTFEGIAYSCGFNSKSSFYRIFKKITGISPSEYKNKFRR